MSGGPDRADPRGRGSDYAGGQPPSIGEGTRPRHREGHLQHELAFGTPTRRFSSLVGHGSGTFSRKVPKESGLESAKRSLEARMSPALSSSEMDSPVYYSSSPSASRQKGEKMSALAVEASEQVKELWESLLVGL